MTRIPAFWDSSAIVPLCVDEMTTTNARRLQRQFNQVVWWASVVEVRGTFARLQRSNIMIGANIRTPLARLNELRRSWHEILPIDEVRECAIDLLDLYPLRSADALQLAAALAWCNRKPARRPFISADIRLCEAATQVGFTVLTP